MSYENAHSKRFLCAVFARLALKFSEHPTSPFGCSENFRVFTARNRKVEKLGNFEVGRFLNFLVFAEQNAEVEKLAKFEVGRNSNFLVFVAKFREVEISPNFGSWTKNQLSRFRAQKPQSSDSLRLQKRPPHQGAYFQTRSGFDSPLARSLRNVQLKTAWIVGSRDTLEVGSA